MLHYRNKNRYKNVKNICYCNMGMIINKDYLLMKMMKRNMIQKQKTKCEK